MDRTRQWLGGALETSKLGRYGGDLALVDRLHWVCLGDTQQPWSRRQLGIRVWSEINPVSEEVGRQPGCLNQGQGGGFC